jgi:hypothetical protein
MYNAAELPLVSLLQSRIFTENKMSAGTGVFKKGSTYSLKLGNSVYLVHVRKIAAEQESIFVVKNLLKCVLCRMESATKELCTLLSTLQ